MQRHHDLIKVTCREIGKRFETIQLILGMTDKPKYCSHLLMLVSYVLSLLTYSIMATLLGVFTFLSAISYSHKKMAFPDLTPSFIVSKLISSVYRLGSSFDSCFPITVVILDQIIQSVQYTTDNLCDQCL